MKLGQKVKVARERRGMTQRDLAKAAEISNGYVSIIENSGNDANHGTAHMMRVAQALRVPLMYLLDPSAPEPRWDEPAEAAPATGPEAA